MKFLRLLLIWLGVLLGLVAVLVAMLFTSPLQTWIAQTMLERQPGLQSSLGDLSADLGHVKVADLRLEFDGAVLTLPSLEAILPVKAAAWDRRFVVQKLVAKGWTLDLSGWPEPRDATSPAAPAPATGATEGTPANAARTDANRVAGIVRGLLGGWKSPYDFALEGAELEGDVIVNLAPDRPPVRVHVVLKGGGLAAGKEGDFTFETRARDPWAGIAAAGAQGRLRVAMTSPRTLGRIGLTADLAAQGALFGGEFVGSVDTTVERIGGEMTGAFALTRDHRPLLTLRARTVAAENRVAGEWKLDWQDRDWAPFAPRRPLPHASLAGQGRFEADGALSGVRFVGQLDLAADHWETLAGSRARVGPITARSRFDLTTRGRTVRVDALAAAIAGPRPVAVVRALRPFDFDAGTGQLQVSDPPGDWLAISVAALPLDWVSGDGGHFPLAGGALSGELVLRAEKDGYSLRSMTPLVAKGLAVEGAGRTLGSGWDATLSLVAESRTDGWRLKWDPLQLVRSGQSVATLTGTASRPAGEDRSIAVSSSWTLNLESLTSQAGLARFGRTLGRQASGEFTATVGGVTTIDGKLTVLGQGPEHSLTATGHADVNAGGSVTFQVPFTVASGKNVSTFTAEGNWSAAGGGTRIIGRLAGEDVDLDHLCLLAAPLAVAVGAPWNRNPAVDAKAGTPALETAPDRSPFWQGWSGEVTLAFDHLRVGKRVFHDVGGTFDVDDASIELKRGWFGLPSRPPTEVTAALSFESSAGLPYRLKATATINDVETAPFLGARPAGEDAMLEGHFSVAAMVTAEGRNLGDLVQRRQEKYQVTGKGGIIRLLKTSVGDALPEDAPTPVADAAGTVGSWVGWLAGVKKDKLGSSEKKVGKTTEAVLNLSSQVAEIGYDRISLTATRGPDRAIHLEAIDVVAADERLTGSGRITGDPGLPVAARRLDAELMIAVHGDIAGLFAQAGLLSGDKDDLGYARLVRPIHVGGSLQQCDTTDWHDLLAKAATAPPPARK